MKRSLLYTMLLLLLVFACTKKEPPQDVLFKVGDKYVTIKEYQYRGEFTPHPNYPRFNRNLEKILLNNLILEKLFVLERGKTSELRKNENFKNFIKGVAEQKMREQLFYKKAFDIVKLDTNEVKKRFILSQREYDLEFYTIYKDSIARSIKAKIDGHPGSAVAIFDNIRPDGKKPTWHVKWKDPDHINIHEALYSGPLKADSVIGPIPLEHNRWIIMKVVDWQDNILLGGEEQLLRWKEVEEKMTMNKATRTWDAFIRDIMRGKHIQFDKDTFLRLADLTYELETANDRQEKSDVMKRFWQEEDSTLTIADLPTEEAFLQRPFFTIDARTWTVGDFRNAVASHPLVYRKNAANRSEFYEQFKIAVADLVRDHYLNKEAYKMGLDKDEKVLRTKEMWQDALVAAYERDQVVKELAEAFPDTSDPYRKRNLEKAFDAYLTDLLEKYRDEIQVDLDEFEKLELSGVQLFVKQEQVPYPVAVPAWPVFSTNNEVNYKPLGKRE